MSSLSFVLFGSNQLQSADFVLENIRKHYPDSYIAILSDCGANYTDISNKYNTEYFYSRKKLSYPVQPFGWRKDKVLDFLERLYIACLRCNTTHIMYVEEDVIIFKQLDIPDDAEIIGFKTCYPDGTKFPNGFPDEFMRIIKMFSGVTPNVTSYGAQGGAVLKVDTFIENFFEIKKFIINNLDYIQDEVYATAGWIDCFLTWYYLLCGKKYTFNPNFIEIFDQSFDYTNPPSHAELATHYQGKYIR
jgi:hypothetical protein